MSAAICPEFTPKKADLSHCECGSHWKHHPQRAKSQFMLHATTALVDEVIDVVREEDSLMKPCSGYFPAWAWESGHGLHTPDCVCGRSSLGPHSASDVMKGLKAFKAGHTSRPREVCNGFYSAIEAPGDCVVCGHTWINHLPAARSNVIEGFEKEHAAWCKCISHNGDHACSCMSDLQIQTVLDKLKKEAPVSCKQFTSKSVGATICQCTKNFYEHSEEARQKFHLFQDWHAANMTDRELLHFLYTLGTTRTERLINLDRLLKDPTFKPSEKTRNLRYPNSDTLKAMLDALTGSHTIMSPLDKEKYQPTQTPPPLGLRGGPALAAVITEADLPILEGKFRVVEDGNFNCYGCGLTGVAAEGDVCTDCEGMYATAGTPTKGVADHKPHQ